MLSIFLISIILLNTFNKSNQIAIKSAEKMLLFDSKSFQVTNDCKEIIIPSNFKKLVLQLQSNNLDEILITDQRITNCASDNIQSCCSTNSTFCMGNINPSSNNFNLNYCIDYTFIYACNLQLNNNNATILNRNISEPSNVTITTSIIRGQGCNTAEFIPETECSSLGLKSCKDSHACYKRCKYVECRTDNSDPTTKVFSMCLPVNLTDSDVIDRCNNHIAFENQTPQVYTKTCQRNYDETDVVQRDSSHTFFKFLAIIFGLSVLTTFIASVYYRFKLSIDNTPPFDPPGIFPNFIFPRTTPNF